MISLIFLGKVGLALPIERFLRIGGMYGVVEEACGEIAPYRAGDRLPGLGRAYHATDEGYSIPALQDDAYARAAADERDQVAEEGLVLVDYVELGPLDLADRLHPDLDGLEAAPLEPADYLADEPPRGRVWLYDDEGPLHRRDGGHLRVVLGPLELARVPLQLPVVDLALG